MPHAIRRVESSDQPVLWEILYEALWDPPASPRRPRSVMSNPLIAAYVQDWGSQSTDLGFLAIAGDDSVAGGILSRLLIPPLAGGAFYDEHTPQLGIAVFPVFRNQGVGTSLFTTFLAAAATRFPRVSLGVHPENHEAIKLYRKFGFYQFATGKGGYLNMVKNLGEPSQDAGAAPGSMDKPHILFVCARNQWRSPTAEKIYRTDPRIEVRSAGVSQKSRHVVSARDLSWADLVMVMEVEHKTRILESFRDHPRLPKIVCLNIPDSYQLMDEELVRLLRDSVDFHLNHEFDIAPTNPVGGNLPMDGPR